MADPLDQYDETFKAAGQEWNVDWRALKAIARQESNGDPNAVSKAGAVGLMQIMPDTGAKLGMTNLRDATQSIYGAAKYMNEALTAEKDNPAAALLYYHGGPGWRGAYGKESANYVPAVAAHYQRYAKTDTGTATDVKPAPAEATPVAQAQKKQDDDPFTRALNAPASTETAPAAAPKAAEPDAFTKALGPPQPQETAPDGQTTARGVARNVAAGVMEGSGAVLDVLRDPVGNLVFRPLTTAGAFLYDAGAHAFGYNPLTPEQRADLTGGSPDYQQPGARLAQAAGAGDVKPASRAEELVRAGAAGAAAAPLIPGGVAIPLGAGVGGAVAGDVASKAVPEWAAPMAALLGNVAGGVGGGVTGAFVRPTVNALAAGVRNAANAPLIEHPLAPRPPEPNALQQRVREVTGQTQGEAPPVAGREAVPGQQTQATGAMVTPPGVARFTPQEEAAYRGSAEGRKLMENQIVGEPDRNEYIPGIRSNAAELEQTVEMARELKGLTNSNVQVSQAAKEAAQANDTIRRGHLQDTAGDDVTTLNVRTARQEDITNDKRAVFAPENVKGDVSMEPLITRIDEVLNEPENRQNTAVQTVLKDLRKRLTNEDGSAKAMEPQEAWGLRQDIDRMTSKRSQSDDKNLHYAAHHLDGVAGILDGAIEGQAPGYANMIARYKAHSQRLEELELLQKATLDMLAKPRLRYEDFQRFMKKLVDGRRAPSNEVNPYKSVSEETMQRLWALRDDLRRSATALELARAQGSDTVPNVVDLLKQYGKLGVPLAGHAIANAISPGWGSVVFGAVQQAAAPVRAARAARREVRRGMQLLNPSPPSDNPLNPP